VGPILFWVGALVVVTLLSPVLLRALVVLVAGRRIGAAVLARQPDDIRLERAAATAWKNGAAPGAIAAVLTSRGFEDAGVYTVPEMPGILVQLLAHPGEGVYAAIYEHAQVGIWFDLVARFQDGTSLTYTTSPATALKPRHGHPIVNLRGSETVAVLDKLLAMRPKRPHSGASVGMAVSFFEQAYAETIAYRKKVGISTREVIQTATRKAA
jgi:hypothetical protein